MIKSIGKNVIISLVKNNEYEKNGIIVKSNSLTNFIGSVISVGSEVNEINVGDKIIYNENDAKKVLFDNSEYFVLNEKEVLAII